MEYHSNQPWYWAVELGDWRLAMGDRKGALEAYQLAWGWMPGEALIEDRIEHMTSGRN
jgi:hypothetical protein